ncbi:helix-turn-helix domain-containing protein [Chryseobacterium oranimense]|uniref:helix-turn-helix domain-containing protein n=1 Tax=Chryseobacterium oranimense TaxID=421058 RepID=UPI00223691E5|nr:helix-turn-helix domain-containing protein [Chryseobacterium oranimense]
MKIKLLLLFIFTGYHLLYPQAKTDSLRNDSYEKLKEKFYDYNYDGNPAKSKLIAQYYLAKAKREKDISQIANGYAFMYANEDQKNALKYIDSLAEITKNLKDDAYPTRIYLLKANVYFKFNNQKEALNNYIIGLKYAKQKNNKRQIALAETNIAYLNSYIGKDSEAAKVLKYYMDNGSYLTDNELDKIRVNLADCYIELNKLDSANILINKGLQAFKNKDDYRYHQYLGLLGFYNLKRKKYQLAINNLLPCKKYFLAADDIREKNYVLLYLGKSYASLNNNQRAIENFTKIDSLVQKTNYIVPEFGEAYTYLIDYYKEKGDKERQLYYVERFLKIDNMLDAQFEYVSRELPRRYDTPKLLHEKENIINDLQSRKTILNISIGLLSIILVLLSFLYSRSKKRERQHRKIAQDLINTVEMRSFETSKAKLITNPSPIPIQTDTENKVITEDKSTKATPEDITQFILKELEAFEDKELFLKKGITSASLAKSIKTNTTYLSEVINTQKGKNFATYLNDLRIDYALNRLIKDKKFRSYKLLAIAEELGYNNEQSFSLAFKKKTGITLSVYIKEIEKSNNI